MADPRKPILRPDDREQDRIRKIAYQHLLKATDAGAQELGCTGATFVVLCMGLWIMELAEVDQKATASMLAALATLHDPAASKTKGARRAQAPRCGR